MMKELQHKKSGFSDRRDRSKPQLLFGEIAVEALLFSTAVERKNEEDEARIIDEWDIDRLDGGNETKENWRRLSLYEIAKPYGTGLEDVIWELP